MKAKLILILSLIVSTYTLAQPFWRVTYLPVDGVVGYLAITKGGVIFASQGDAMWRSSDEGKSWVEMKTTTPSPLKHSIAIDRNERIYFGGSGVFFSDDLGDNWLRSESFNESCQRIVVNRNDEVFASSGSNGVFLSKDRGITWSLVLKDTRSSVIKLHVVPKSQSIIAQTGRGSDTLYRSTDNGDTWNYIDAFDSTLIAYEFASDSLGNVYCTGGKKGGNGPYYIMKSTDDGITWSKLWMHTVSVPRPILVNSLGHIYVGTYGAGVYRSTDGGQTVEQLYQGLEHLAADALALMPDGRIVNGSRRRVHISLKSTTSTESIPLPQELSLSQNYPNPAHGLTSVSFSLPQSGVVSLTLHNILGARVQTVISGHQLPPGEHNATLDVSTLPAGVYVLQLHVAGRVVSRMVLVE